MDLMKILITQNSYKETKQYKFYEDVDYIEKIENQLRELKDKNEIIDFKVEMRCDIKSIPDLLEHMEWDEFKCMIKHIDEIDLDVRFDA